MFYNTPWKRSKAQKAAALPYFWRPWTTIESAKPAVQVANEVSNACLECLRSVLNSDASLDAALQMAKAVVTVTRRSVENTDIRLSGKVLALLSEIKLEAKLFAAEREDAAFGGAANVLSSEMRKSVSSGFIHGGLERMKKMHVKLLQEIFVLYLRILRHPDYFAVDAVLAAVAGFSGLSHLVNVELLAEILTEFRRLLADFHVPPFVQLTIVEACLSLGSGVGAALQIDISWVAEVLSKLMDRALPSLSGGARTRDDKSCFSLVNLLLEDDEPRDVTITRRPDGDPEMEFSEAELTELRINQGEFTRRLVFVLDAYSTCPLVVGTAGAFAARTSAGTGSHLILVQATAKLAAQSNPRVGVLLLDQLARLIQRFPRLMGVIDRPGAIVSHLQGPVSIFWQLELIANSLDCDLQKAVHQLFQGAEKKLVDDQETERRFDRVLRDGKVRVGQSESSLDLQKLV